METCAISSSICNHPSCSNIFFMLNCLNWTELVPLSPYRSPNGWCVPWFGCFFPTPPSSVRMRMGPPSIPPTTGPTLPCWTTMGRVATCSLISPWLGRFPVATSSGRLLMPALLPLWPSATSLPPTAMWGPNRSSPLSLRSAGPWAWEP
eukprot:jgi/Mesvir1/21278/Mv25978-RA.1